MEPITQQTFKEFYIKGTKFRVFTEDHIITVYNEKDLSRQEINASIRYMILEGIIEMDTYQVNVYSVK
jgi:hypothetical protein